MSEDQILAEINRLRETHLKLAGQSVLMAAMFESLRQIVEKLSPELYDDQGLPVPIAEWINARVQTEIQSSLIDIEDSDPALAAWLQNYLDQARGSGS